jgi:hypothetical protein
MANFPKVDSAGLRLAKSTGAKRVSSVIKMTLRAPSSVNSGHFRSAGQGKGSNGGAAISSESGRKESR